MRARVYSSKREGLTKKQIAVGRSGNRQEFGRRDGERQNGQIQPRLRVPNKILVSGMRSIEATRLREGEVPKFDFAGRSNTNTNNFFMVMRQRRIRQGFGHRNPNRQLRGIEYSSRPVERCRWILARCQPRRIKRADDSQQNSRDCARGNEAEARAYCQVAPDCRNS